MYVYEHDDTTGEGGRRLQGVASSCHFTLMLSHSYTLRLHS